MTQSKVLYCGDSDVGGAANYLLALLSLWGARVTHVPPAEKLSQGFANRCYDLVIFSDYSCKNLLPRHQESIAGYVRSGRSGLLMVGGWGSFSGPFGGWRGSQIESCLPVKCSIKDDRVNFPGGAWVSVRTAHKSIANVSFNPSPVICGLNKVIPRKDAVVVLNAHRLMTSGDGVKLEKIAYPLLVTSSPKSSVRSAVFTTDFAPHWCGGFVDWGKRTRVIPVNRSICVQVGNSYIQFAHRLFEWLAVKRSSRFHLL